MRKEDDVFCCSGQRGMGMGSSIDNGAGGPGENGYGGGLSVAGNFHICVGSHFSSNVSVSMHGSK